MSRVDVDVQCMVRLRIFHTTCVIADFTVSLFASAKLFAVIVSLQNHPNASYNFIVRKTWLSVFHCRHDINNLSKFVWIRLRSAAIHLG